MKVLITGATGGIGGSLVGVLCERGHDVLATGRNQAKLQGLAQRFGVEAIRADLGETDARTQLANWSLARNVDAVVHCAGRVRYEPWSDLTPDSIEEQLSTNLTAPLLLSTEIAKGWTETKTKGALVFFSSTLASKPAPHTLAYAAAKAAANAVVRGLALSLGPHGIRVNGIGLGVVDTEMVKAKRPGPAPDLGALHPVGRIGSPEEAARAAAYLLEAEFVTGQVLTVDGGLLIAP